MLIATTGSMLLVTIAWSSENALFSGRVFQADGASPHVGVVVALFDDESGKVFRSQPTDDDGAFSIDAAPAGSYAVVTETPEGAFLAGEEIQLEQGANRPLSLTLTSTPPAGTLAPAQASGSKSGMSAAVKWGITGGIVLAALFVIDDLTEDTEKTASDF
jgi:hypothetical protein